MVYSLWIIFFLIILGMILKIRSMTVEYLREKNEEKRQSELMARMTKDVEEMLTRQRNQGQTQANQGQTVDLAEMLGAQQKGGFN